MTDRSTPATTASSFDVLHFSTVFPGRALPRLIRRIESRGVQVVYDLEDTHWIPTDAALTTELKRRARLDLAELLESPFATGPSFGVKVNPFGRRVARGRRSGVERACIPTGCMRATWHSASCWGVTGGSSPGR